MSPQEPQSAATGDRLADEVRDCLLTLADGLGTTKAARVDLRWGLLFVGLASQDVAYVQGLELIYEGYLLHYRGSRVLSVDGDREGALLAGDVFYARGLRKIAGRGGVDAVALLTRLMASCAYLRSLPAPFEVDDALWAWATAGLAGLTTGCRLDDAVRVFDETDSSLARRAFVDVGALASAEASRLRLTDARPLLDELTALGRRATVPASSDIPSERS